MAFLFSLKTLFLLGILLVQSNFAIILDPDGGYHVTIGMQNYGEISDQEAYIERVKTEFTKLSNIMHQSTQTFYIKTIKIVVPSQWQSEADATALRESVASSDIKISQNFIIPDVIRGTQCGYPGEEMRLSVNFFNETMDDIYKSRDKSLLHLWAMFRWGVFEESGFPGNDRFPYFHRPSSTSDWEVNICTDNDLVGDAQYLDGTLCELSQDATPDTDCRFVPEDPQPLLVKTSLMTQFHWIEGLDSFCDENTHDITLPNRQNTLCAYKSASEIIKSCVDFKKVTEQTEPMPPTFTVLKESDKPWLYFILDSRFIHQIPTDSVEQIKTELSALFTSGSGVDQDSLGALSIFPGRIDENEDFEEIIPWSVITDRIEDFRNSADFVDSVESSLGLYGRAIKSASESIRVRNHDAGSYIFVFKSANAVNMEKMPFEQEVVASLIAHKVKVFAVELNNNEQDAGTNLRELTAITGGGHFSINRNSIPDELSDFIKAFIEATKSSSFLPPQRKLIEASSMQSKEQEVEIFYQPENPVHIKVTTSVYVTNVILKIDSEDISVVEADEWVETSQERRKTFSAIHNEFGETDILSISLECSNEIPQEMCTGYIAIFEEIAESSPSETPELLVSTSAGEGVFRETEAPQGALLVYANLQENGTPLLNMEEIGRLLAIATFCNEESRLCWTVEMTDNGAGFPDLMKNDGIISGAFQPPLNGSYTLWVSVKFGTGAIKIESKQLSISPRSVRDDIFPCSLSPTENCVGTVPTSGFYAVASLPHSLVVIKSDEAPGQPAPIPILDLRLSPSETGVILKWIVPSVYKNGTIEKPEKYDIRYCDTFASIYDDFSSCISIPEEILPTPGLPGEKEEIFFEMDGESFSYFAIKSEYGGISSDLSNIVWGMPSGPIQSTPQSTTGQTEDTTNTEDTTVSTQQTEDTTTPTSHTDTTTHEESTSESSTAFTTTEESTTDETETDSTTTEDDSTTSFESTTTEPTASTTEVTPTSSSTLETSQSTDETTTDSEPTEESTPEISSTMTSRPTTTTSTTTEAAEYFFERTEGYVTIAVIVLVSIGGLGGAVGYLFWKRKNLMIAKQFDNKVQ